MQDERNTIAESEASLDTLDLNAAKFADSFASFNRVINGLQRKYIELKEEFSAQNEKLADANRRLMELTESNLAANQFLNGVLDSMPVSVITVDREGIVTHLNPAASIMFNKDARKAVGLHYSEIVKITSGANSGALSTLKSGNTFSSAEKEIILGGDRKVKVSVSTALLKDEVDNCVGAVEVFQDLTKVRKMEQEIARLNTLAALGEMAATIAHEVRNPLSGIGGFAALLERDVDKNDPKSQLIQKIKRGVETLNNTVTKLLNYTRFNELSRTEVDFVGYLRQSIEQFRHIQPGGQQFVITLYDNGMTKPGNVIVSIDKLLFRQCFFNMLTNSIEAAGQKAITNVSIKVFSNQKIPATFANKINLEFDESLLAISIADNGPGIKPEYRDKIFAPFFTTKGGGSGLGLAVAWKLIKAHGGDIVLGESSDLGTTFHILLPARINNTQLESSL
jgi:signal transduction histidine kinase